MSAPSKRRRVSYYLSLPVVITVVFLLVAKLVAMQRAEIIAELSDRVAHRGSEDASAAVRQLGEMPQPPAAVLVAAATATDRRVASEAQQTISRLLRRAQQKLETGRGAKALSQQLTELARELADHRHAFVVADQAWLTSTTQRILRLANQVPHMHAPVVAANCDLILASMHTTTASDAEPANPHDLAKQHAPSSVSTTVPEASHENSPVESREQGESESNDVLFAPWRADWSRPVFRTLPATPSDARPINPNASPSPPSHSTSPKLPEDSEAISRPLADVDTRTLLQNWLAAQGGELLSLEQELLRHRSFGRLPKPLVQKLFSSPQDRRQLVDDVLKEPGVNARPWLTLLVNDRDADVRLAAVTIVATSNDATLVEQAWQTAIHDRDPRVAALASRLRERRAAIQRR